MPEGISSPSYIREKLSPLGLYIVARNIGNLTRPAIPEERLDKMMEIIEAMRALICLNEMLNTCCSVWVIPSVL